MFADSIKLRAQRQRVCERFRCQRAQLGRLKIVVEFFRWQKGEENTPLSRDISGAMEAGVNRDAQTARRYKGANRRKFVIGPDANDCCITKMLGKFLRLDTDSFEVAGSIDGQHPQSIEPHTERVAICRRIAPDIADLLHCAEETMHTGLRNAKYLRDLRHAQHRRVYRETVQYLIREYDRLYLWRPTQWSAPGRSHRHLCHGCPLLWKLFCCASYYSRIS